MWHASGNGGTVSKSRSIARHALAGVGDASLGEWIEEGRRGIVHVRRRLSSDEQHAFGIAEVRDIRNTNEERDRLAALLADAPHLRAVFGFLSPSTGDL